MAGQKVVNIHDYPLDPAAAKRHILRLWKEGKFLPSGHVQQRMRERSISTDHIGQVFRSGRVTDWSKPGDCWRYSVQGTTIDGAEIVCVVEIERRLILITVIDKTIKKKK